MEGAESSKGFEVDKKLEQYKVGEEVNCFVKSVRVILCLP